MSNRLFEKGREGFLDGTCDWDTNSFKAMLMSATVDTQVKAITNATNANPIAYTVTAHGWSVGDVVQVLGVLGNLAANGTFLIGTVVDANTLNLTTLTNALPVKGSAAYTSGGIMINLTQAVNLSDVDAGRVGTDQTYTSPTVALGVAGAANPSWTAVSGSTVVGIVSYKDTGTAGTSRLVLWQDGKILVTVAKDAASTDTTLWVEALSGPIPSGTSMVMSNGVTVVTNAVANVGDRAITILSCPAAIVAGNTCDVATTNSNLPVVPNGGTISETIDATSGNKLFKL